MNIKKINKVIALLMIVVGGLIFLSDGYLNIDFFSTVLTPYILLVIGILGLVFTEKLTVLINSTYSTLFLIGVALFVYTNFEILNSDKLIFYSWLIFPMCIFIKIGYDLENERKYYGIGIIYFMILFSLYLFYQNIVELLIIKINNYLQNMFSVVIIVLGAYILSKNSN